MTDTIETTRSEELESGAVIYVPLSKLKKSPKNARRTPHGEAAIEALAASIAAKGMLQPPLVEPERDRRGEPTGCYLVTIGEGRRLAQLLRVKRKQIGKEEPIRCVLDLENDPHEISLDENVTRSEMHPADQFEAFSRLALERNLSPEEIAARFGVSANVVRQRLRLAAVSPKLMALYREGELALEELMAFAVSEDHARQEQVLEALTWNRYPHQIRRMMTEANVPATDRRAVFVGLETYVDAGGRILRDLFTEDGGGWLEDVGLLDRLALEKLECLSAGLREAEGWKWSQASADFPHGQDLRRIYPHRIEQSAAEIAEAEACSAEHDALFNAWQDADEVPPEIEEQLRTLAAKLTGFEQRGWAFDPADVARAGIIVCIDQSGEARVERGLVRAEGEAAEPETSSGLTSPAVQASGSQIEVAGVEKSLPPLSEKLVRNLSAHRTMGLRDALASSPAVALVAVTHALVLRTFYAHHQYESCIEIDVTSVSLAADAPEASEGNAGRRMHERHEQWASQLPRSPGEVWNWIRALSPDERTQLLAYCVATAINAVVDLHFNRAGVRHAGVLASVAALDMRECWAPTAEAYCERVTKAQMLSAVREAVSDEAAVRIEHLTKPDMARAAEALLSETAWLPELLRTQPLDEPPAAA